MYSIEKPIKPNFVYEKTYKVNKSLAILMRKKKAKVTNTQNERAYRWFQQ